jgi:hypothetical protein
LINVPGRTTTLQESGQQNVQFEFDAGLLKTASEAEQTYWYCGGWFNILSVKPVIKCNRVSFIADQFFIHGGACQIILK